MMNLINRENRRGWIVDSWGQGLTGDVHDYAKRKKRIMLKGAFLIYGHQILQVTVSQFAAAFVDPKQRVAIAAKIAYFRYQFDEAVRSLAQRYQSLTVEG